MSQKQKKYTYLILVLLFGLAVFLTCSDKIINNSENTNSIEFDMSVKFTSEQQQELAEIVTTYQVIILADDDTIKAELEFADGSITGLIENVPAGPNRVVIVEGLAPDGTVIYSGTTTITVVAGQTVDAVVTLKAVGKLVRITPKYKDQNYGSKFTSAVKVDNIAGLSNLSLTIAYDANVIKVDSVKKGAGVPGGATFTSNIATLSTITILVNHSSTVVDSSGNAALAHLFFTPGNSNSCLDSSLLDLGVSSLTAPSTTTNDIYVDDAWIKITRGKLNVAPSMLAFGAGIQGLNLNFKQVNVADSCGNPTPFTISTQTDWIDLNPAQAGLTPGTIYIDVDTTGLGSGFYEGAVTINAPRAVNSPFDIAVTLNIDKGARILDVLPDTLYFVATENGALPSSKTFQVFETNGFSINFTANESIPWLDISGISSNTPDTIIAAITNTELGFGTYTGTITISSVDADNSPQNVAVVYTVNKGPRVLAANPTQLNFTVTEFGDLPENQTFDVTETGGYTIPYSTTENISWLSLSGASGNTNGTVTASVTTSSLSPGVFTDSIRVSSVEANNSPIFVKVNLTVEQASRNLETIPDTLFFTAFRDDALPSSQTFIVNEVNSIPTSFNASETSGLFNISGVSGNTPDTITVNILTTAMDAGTYTDNITISSAQASNSPQTVTIVYTVEIGERVILASPDSLHLVFVEFSDDYPAGQFVVSELNDFQISFDAIEDIPWLFLSEVSGTTKDTILVYTEPEIGAGIYVDPIMITSEEADNSPVYVVVVLEVQEAPKYLATNVDSVYLQYIEYDDAVPTANFDVFEINGYNISFDATSNAPWMTLGEIDGTTPDNIFIYPSINFEPGVYVDSVMISSEDAENSPIYLKVVYEIVDQPMPMLIVSPDTLKFRAQEDGALPDSKSFLVSSSNYQTGFMSTETIDWLELIDGSGATGSSVTVDISSTTLAPGIYFDSVYVYTDDINFVNAYEYIEYTVVDTIPPAAVADLNVVSNTASSAVIDWTSSGDDGNTGTATETDLRYADDLTTLFDWTNAIEVTGEPTPQLAGSSEQFEVSNLAPGNTYYFALDIIDNVGNNSGISNVDSVYIPLLAPDVPVLAAPANGSIAIAINIAFVWQSAGGADSYELQYDTEVSFGEPNSFDNLSDTTLNAGPLNYETTYYWRVRAVNSDAMSDWSTVWSFTTENTPPTIAGLVRDGSGNNLSDVKIIVYDYYPGGNKFDSTVSDQNGRFEFFDLNGNYDLYSLKEGYYPQVTAVDAPDSNVNVFLIAQPNLNPSDQWVDFYCDNALAHRQPIQVNDVVEAFDPTGILCGRFVVTIPGAYGFMPVYRDDSNTPGIDEGCETGDFVTLKVNGETAVANLPIVYPAGINQQVEACFDVTGEVSKFIVISEPAGGETYFVDSSITVRWSSTGISGPLVLYLSNSTISPIPLDTIDNDGEHTFILSGFAQADDWLISLVDEDESVSGSSNIFTISAVELIAEPTSLFFHSTVGGCLPGQKQFTISSTHGFNIPFEIEDTVSWLSVSPLNGTTPAVITVSTLANSLPLGTYNRSLVVNSPSAINSPISIDVEFEVGNYFCGDFNGDCKLGPSDVNNLINFLYRGGIAPLYPGALNVDLCEDVDIADVDLLYNLINQNNPAICEGVAFCADISNDIGVRDSMKFVVASAPNTEDSTPTLQLDLYLYNDANTIYGLSNGFSWDNPNMILDSVKYTQVVENNVSFRFAFEDNVIDTSNANQRFLFAVYKTIFSGIPPSGSHKHLASYYFTLTSWNAGDSLEVDINEFNSGTTYKASTPNGAYAPHWGGAIIITE